MNKIHMSLIGLAAAILLVGSPQLVRACDGWPGGFGSRYAFGYSGSLYGLGYVPVPPYFALHPPVYYGTRFYRSYGGSPYARRASDSRPRRLAARVVVNPFVVQHRATKKPAVKIKPKTPAAKTAQTQMIYNPYYHATSVAQSK